MNLQQNMILNLVENENLIPYQCIHADDKKIVFAPLIFGLNKDGEPVEIGADEAKKIEFLI
ncbi:hypothetical protein [Megamonas hypermegale]|uniref:hypothetical protein n=1 Tax=Megamonas hypermegale TaxID=158847 RepID=UPI0026EA2BDB|nr:hypothetical protein [Megamonas hypermegale]